jgi:transcriptional regulator GlxA family with amidase domain
MKRVALVISPGFQTMSFAAMSVFEFANGTLNQDFYRIDVLSENGGLVPSSLGMTADTKAFDRKARSGAEYDTVIFGSGPTIVAATPGMLAYVQRAAHTSRRIASICTGAFVLAEAGVLDGRRATTHWIYARELESRFPKITVDEDRIYVIDGPVWTSAGMTAGIDLALAMVDSDLGSDIARLVAKKLVVFHRRGGGQSQHSTLLELEPKSDRVQSALIYAKGHLHEALTVDELAAIAHLSPRQFSRAFRAETGQTPAKAVENLRVEAARLLMEQSRHSIDIVARETGFSDRRHMRGAFLRAFGQPPQVIRRNARAHNDEHYAA